MTTTLNKTHGHDNKRPVVFICGPMSGYKNYNREAFHEAAKQLESLGYIVLNPAVFPDGLQHHQYMDITLAMLNQANVIWLLDGWSTSKGAQEEVERAHSLGLYFSASRAAILSPLSALFKCCCRIDLSGERFAEYCPAHDHTADYPGGLSDGHR